MDPLWAWWHMSHPQLVERLEAIDAKTIEATKKKE